MRNRHALTVIEEIVEDHRLVQDKLLGLDPSTAQNVSQHLLKILILSCGSYYEQTLKDAIKKYFVKKSNYYRQKPHRFMFNERTDTVYRLFKFGATDNPEDQNVLKSTKSFLEPLNYFGDKFYRYIIDLVTSSEELDKSAQAFQEMFSMRNLIAHNSYLQARTIRGKSFDDIKTLHDEAIKFVDFLTSIFT